MYNNQGGENRWIGKPEGSPATTKYPNLVAEVVFSRIWLDSFADAANVSMEIMTAVMEDSEELSRAELERMVEWINATESPGYLVSLEYMASPVLSRIDSSGNKGRWYLRQLKSLHKSAQSIGEDYRVFADSTSEQTQSLISKMEAGDPIPYSSYRVAAGVLDRAIRMSQTARTKRVRRIGR